jgi:RNA polymerase sigma-70 factor (ECF subfamily)
VSAQALEQLYRAEWGRILAALFRLVGDLDVAEEAAQEAFALALDAWARDGTPRNPRAWIVSTARHKAIDRLRRRARFADKAALIAAEIEAAAEGKAEHAAEPPTLPDERLRLVFTCCHPALALPAQVALTLHTVLGLTTDEIAHAFLVESTTMAQRLVRAKAKIREAGIPYRVPEPEELDERLDAVMAVTYLVFNEGYAAAQGDTLVRHELCSEAIRLARLVDQLLPRRSSELEGLLALMLLHDARRQARVDAAGDLVLLELQDRACWDRAQIAEGLKLVRAALVEARGRPRSYALQSAIAAVHGEARAAADTDWRQIVTLYEMLSVVAPSPVVALNHAVAVAMVDGIEQGLALVETLRVELAYYRFFHAARADLLRRLGRKAEAALAYEAALARTASDVERRFLLRRLDEVRGV